MTQKHHFQNFDDIKAAVLRGDTVHWKTDGYVVRLDRHSYRVVHTTSGHAIGLFWLDGVTSDHDPKDFYAYSDN